MISQVHPCIARSECQTISDPVVLTGAHHAGLESFDAVTIIDDRLVFFNLSITTTAGQFNALSRVGGDVDVQSNGDLKTLGGFGRLEEIGNMFSILDNPKLQALQSKIFSLRLLALLFELTITSTHRLNDSISFFFCLHSKLLDRTAMDVLENCRPVSGAYCTAVSDPTMRAAFYKLQVVGGHFLIQLNPSLAQISSFKELVTVGGELRIESNNVLHRIECKQFLGCVTGLGICNPSTSSYALWRMVKELLWYCWCSGLFGFYLIVSWV